MKRKFQRLLAAWLVGAFLILPVQAASSFPDVDEDADYAEAVEYLNEIGVMEGDDQGNFNPDKAVSRAEMATIICRMLGETENLTTGSDFTDVPESHWANKYIAKAVGAGIVGGYGNGKFGPGDTVTLEQTLKMLINAVGLGEIAEENGGYPDGYLAVANDYGYINRVSAEKGDMLKRWQIAVILYNSMA